MIAGKVQKVPEPVSRELSVSLLGITTVGVPVGVWEGVPVGVLEGVPVGVLVGVDDDGVVGVVVDGVVGPLTGVGEDVGVGVGVGVGVRVTGIKIEVTPLAVLFPSAFAEITLK